MNILTEELKNHQIERRFFKVLFNLQHIPQVNIMFKGLFLQYCVRGGSLETCLVSQLSGRGSDLRNPLDLSSVSVTIHPDKLSLKRNTFSSTSKKCSPILRGERKEILI